MVIANDEACGTVSTATRGDRNLKRRLSCRKRVNLSPLKAGMRKGSQARQKELSQEGGKR